MLVHYLAQNNETKSRDNKPILRTNDNFDLELVQMSRGSGYAYNMYANGTFVLLSCNQTL